LRKIENDLRGKERPFEKGPFLPPQTPPSFPKTF